MANPTRGTTRGNTPVDFAILRKDISRTNPALDQLLALAVPVNGVSPQADEHQKNKAIDQFKLQRLSQVISSNITAAADLREITPYIAKAELIWQTLLCYPNGKQARILSRDTQGSSIKNTGMHEALLLKWDEYYTNDYKIEADLKDIISDLLINTGSYPLMTLSNPDLDYLINGSQIAGVTGNESFVNSARAAFNREFVRVAGDKRIKVMNKGVFVRNPEAPVAPSRLSGLEAILTNGSRGHAEEEFALMGKSFDTENLFGITLTDNLNALYLQRIENAARQDDIASVTGVESLGAVIQSVLAKKEEVKEEGTYTDSSGKVHKAKISKNSATTTSNLSVQQLEELTTKIYPHRNVQQQSVQYVKPMDALSRKPFGRGLTFKLPSEAVFPVGSDFIVLLDPETGEFLSTANDFTYQSTGVSPVNQQVTRGSTNQLITNLRNIQEGKPCNIDMKDFVAMTKAKLIERFIACTVSNRGANMSIELSDDVVKIFLSRIFRAQGVRCLYVPGEAMTYMALNYNRMGVGQSLVQQAKNHIMRLAALELADAAANLEGATPHTEMTIDLDPKTPEPFADIASAKEAYFANNPSNVGMLASGVMTIPDVAENIRRNSLNIVVNANDNPWYPKTQIKTDQKEKDNFKTVDETSIDKLKDTVSNYLHLNKSWLDTSDDQNNFQIEAVAQHELLLNQIVNWQESLGGQIADFERKHALKNVPLLQALVQVIKDNRKLWTPDTKEDLPGDDAAKVNAILVDFINNVTVAFPAPNSIDNASKLKDNIGAVDELVKAWVEMACTGENLTQVAALLGIDTSDDMAGEGEGAKASTKFIKEQVKAVLMMDAFRRYNLPMPFDQVVNGGLGGGVATIVQRVIDQRSNLALFLAEMVIGVSDADAKSLKTHAKKIENAMERLKKAQDKLGIDGGDSSNLENDQSFGGDAGGEGDGNTELSPTGDDLTDNLDNAGGENTGEEEQEEEEEDETNTTSTEDSGKPGGDGLDPSKNDPDYQPFE